MIDEVREGCLIEEVWRRSKGMSLQQQRKE